MRHTTLTRHRIFQRYFGQPVLRATRLAELEEQEKHPLRDFPKLRALSGSASTSQFNNEEDPDDPLRK